MTEQTVANESAPGRKVITIIRQVVQWGILVLLLFTVFMAAYRKFGG